MANKLLYSTGNKLIYGVGNKLVYSDIVMSTMYVTVSFTGSQSGGITSVLAYHASDFSGIWYNASSSGGVAAGFSTGGTSFSRNKTTALDFKTATLHGGRAWSGTYWQYEYLAWDWTGGTAITYNGVTINLTFAVEDKTISTSFELAQKQYDSAFVAAQALAAVVRWTPSTHTLEFI
jgi:hypothetical protein